MRILILLELAFTIRGAVPRVFVHGNVNTKHYTVIACRLIRSSTCSLVSQVITALADSQHPDGGWRQPRLTGKHARLGQAGDAVSGTVARQTMDLLRHARITGSSASLKPGLKALGFLTVSIP